MLIDAARASLTSQLQRSGWLQSDPRFRWPAVGEQFQRGVYELIGVGRDINRHTFTPEEVDAALRRPVVVAVMEALRLRNTHPAFDGQFTFGPGPTTGSLWMEWANGENRVHLDAVPVEGTFRLAFSDVGGERVASSVGELVDLGIRVPEASPASTRWGRERPLGAA